MPGVDWGLAIRCLPTNPKCFFRTTSSTSSSASTSPRAKSTMRRTKKLARWKRSATQHPTTSRRFVALQDGMGTACIGGCAFDATGVSWQHQPGFTGLQEWMRKGVLPFACSHPCLRWCGCVPAWYLWRRSSTRSPGSSTRGTATSRWPISCSHRTRNLVGPESVRMLAPHVPDSLALPGSHFTSAPCPQWCGR